MVEKLAEGIYRIPIRPEGNPLKELNSYVFRCGDRDLLIDTGFNQPACLRDLQAGLDELGLDMDRTDIYLTHFHADHCGLLSQVKSPRSKAYMGAVDRALFLRNAFDREEYWLEWERDFLQEGFSPEALAEVMATNPAKHLADRGGAEIIPVEDGQEIPVGNRRFRCIFTPGHTPGHMCLYEPDSRTMVLGDHVLYHITPNITAWPSLPNALKHYFDSLEKIRLIPIDLPLPSHRAIEDRSVAQRINELLAHHHQRLRQVLDIVTAQPGLSAYQIAGRMTWSIRAKSWEDFPPPQKWFATGEAKSHLEYLMAEGKVRREGSARHTYYAAE